MNSGDVKRLLEPMTNFVPAIMRAAEIIESMEKAEARLPELDNAIAAKAQQLKDLDTQRQQFENRLQAARRDFLAERDRIDTDREALRASLEPLRAEVAKAMTERDRALAGKDEELNARLKQIKEADSKLTEIKDQIAKAKKAILAA